jgi:hypothetical protein
MAEKTWPRNTTGIMPHLWKPGQSGNPKGRPKKLSLIKEWMEEPSFSDANKTKLRVLFDKMYMGAIKGNVTLQIWLMEKVDGKPKQLVEHEDQDGKAYPAMIPIMIGACDDINAAIEKAQGQIADEVRRLHEQDSDEGDDESNGGDVH